MRWDPPSQDLRRRAIEGPLGYQIFRGAWPPGERPCDGCPEDLKPAVTLDAAERLLRGLPEDAWADPDTQQGSTYRYRIRAIDPAERLGAFSVPVQIRWVTIPPPAIEAEPGDRQAVVRILEALWPPGVEGLAVRVYGPGGSLIAEARAGAASVLVLGLQNGTPYDLSVRLAGRTEEGWIVESAGAPAPVTPVDRTPPLPPADLVTLQTSGGVLLRWLPQGEEPYAQVIVFQSEDDRGPTELARLPGAALSYLDRAAAPGRTYTYALVALDQAGNRSLPTPSVRASPR